MILKDFHDHYNNRYQFCPKLFPEQLTHTHRHCLELKTKIICIYLSILSQNAPFFNTLWIGLIFCPLYTACVHIHLSCTLYVCTVFSAGRGTKEAKKTHTAGTR